MATVDETGIKALAEAQKLSDAATAAIEAYGPELLSFLHGLLNRSSDADEAFSQTCEDLWAALPRFEWRSSLRTWMYVLARHAAARHVRSPARRGVHNLELSQVSQVAEQVRSRTAPFLRTEVKDAFAEIRESLSPDDRALLMLRVDRALDWKDIAVILFEEEASASPQALSRVTARLRKRFQAIKEEIREQALRRGLLDS